MHVNTITNIQLLRAIAAINVVLVHIIGTSKLYGFEPYLLNIVEGWGIVGVDLFFVISGFIMVYIQYRRPQSSLKFFKNRLLRILPTYWFLTTIYATLLFFAPKLFNQMEFSSIYTLCSFFFLSGFIEDKHPLLFVGWSVEYEMLFYALFAAAYWFGSLRIAIFITIIALICLVFMYGANSMFLEFSFGMLIGLLYTKNKINKSIAK